MQVLVKSDFAVNMVNCNYNQIGLPSEGPNPINMMMVNADAMASNTLANERLHGSAHGLIGVRAKSFLCCTIFTR